MLALRLHGPVPATANANANATLLTSSYSPKGQQSNAST